MNFHSIRVKSTIPMLMLGVTLLIVVSMFSYLSAMQRSALDAQADNFLKAISVVLNADRDLYQAKLATTHFLNKFGDIEQQRKDVAENAEQVKGRFGEYLGYLKAYPDVTGQFSRFDREFSQWLQSTNSLIGAADNQADLQALIADEEQKFSSLRAVLDEAGDAALQKSISEQQALTASISRFQWLTYGISLTILLIAGWFSYQIPRALTGQINFLTRRINEIASGEGDLTARLTVQSRDEFAELAHEFNGFVANLCQLIASVLQQAGQLSKLTEHLSQSANNSKNITNSLNVASDSIVSAVHEMTIANKEMAVVATNSAHEADLASRNAEQGLQVVDSVNQSMTALSSDVDMALSCSTELENSSENIASVLDVIRSIADQTNLLALNAAIEAARAGEQGRGFAVVADEVRTLASRTQQSTNHIQEMIQSLQSRVNQASGAINSGKANADRTLEFFAKADQVFHQLQESSRRVNDMATQTAAATEEQSLVSEEITKNLYALHDQASAAGGIAESNEQLSAQIKQLSNTLFGLVGRFKVS
ncbi:methyl-accepting chemotaxis protein [Rheinheimera riviphila]|uniref:Methyl-accepting chemotaxis protein n=1 Tax=Rheinheimera riviphila TaxID=1834037 RepID=A0A437QFE8_9GAMM|nr:methyl-accepting chemotaxis protein [Rheinheimera riviphila]RVU33255.1 methyl-accepting chemotaxis protein [Rheinheimera riviphila]